MLTSPLRAYRVSGAIGTEDRLGAAREPSDTSPSQGTFVNAGPGEARVPSGNASAPKRPSVGGGGGGGGGWCTAHHSERMRPPRVPRRDVDIMSAAVKRRRHSPVQGRGRRDVQPRRP